MLPEVGKPLPTHPAYSTDKQARAFWRLSYTCGRAYADGLDAKGEAVLVKHEVEQDDSYSRRKRTTKVRNHCGPIVRRYNDFVFRQPAKRHEAGSIAVYDQLTEDADGQGTPLAVFMRRSLLLAQIDREVYLLPDSNRPDDGIELTKAQADAQGTRAFLRRIDADSVVWWRDVDGILAEGIVVLVRPDGEAFARWYGPRATRDIELRKRDHDSAPLIVASVGPERAHAYGGCPLVRLRPLFDSHGLGDGESQIAPLAELQQEVYNDCSLLKAELYGATFSQIVATGVSADQIGVVERGNNRLICFPNPAAAFSVVGADPKQAESIRNSIEDVQRELYRIAGVSTGDPLSSPGEAESGVAKAFRFNDLAANLSALADATEDAENAVIGRLFAAMGGTPPDPADYPNTFDMPDLKGELETLCRALLVRPLPAVLKAQMIRGFAKRNVALDEKQQQELETQLLDIGAEDELDEPTTFGRKPGT